MIIDAHHHLWNLSQVRYPWLEAKGVRRFFGDPAAIQRDYLVEDFRADWAHIPVEGSVHIQVGAAPGEELAETEWLERQARESGLPSAIIAFADLTSPGLEHQLDRHQAASDRLRGVRQIVSRHPDEDTGSEGEALLRNPAFSRGLHTLAGRGLSFDLQLTPPLLQTAAEVFAAIPDLRVALCHAGSPWHQDAASLKSWTAGLEAFAQVPNAMCKLSGLGMFDPQWTRNSLRPIIEGVLQVFGSKRVMWGSNFPVDKLYRDYKSLFDTTWELIPKDARASVFGLNAIGFYRLPLREADLALSDY